LNANALLLIANLTFRAAFRVAEVGVALTIICIAVVALSTLDKSAKVFTNPEIWITSLSFRAYDACAVIVPYIFLDAHACNLAYVWIRLGWVVLCIRVTLLSWCQITRR
jgi:hypothetical protein